MSELAQQQQTQQGVIAEIRSQEFRQQLAVLLPGPGEADRFASVAVMALMEDRARQPEPSKQLLACDRRSLFQAILACARDDLLPDGREAALVKRGNKVAYQPMVRGLRKIAGRYGWMIRSAAVRERDEFSWEDEPPMIRHRVFAPGERGELLYAYAVAVNIDGRRMQRVMTREEVLKRAASATSKNVWEAWPDEMWAKTPARDIFQDLALSIDLRERLRAALAASELAPGDAADQIYGPQDAPSPDPSAPPEPAPSAAGQEGARDGSEGAQPLMPGAPAAPSDEPEPGPELELVGDAALEALAEAAAGFVPPNGKYAEGGDHGPKTLVEIAALGEPGAKWFAWALPRITDPPEYAAALWSFARARLPEQYQEAAARRALEGGE